ncbi:unnamed protein product [Clonostachys rosea]|uniref:Uncharacterized protein n=1 Tax=Bionectria ochroleuca TaxID=29856 RepID=A0ABY6V071_BIOOC|nr:unnamed protein product [Clonostachys rosea]
MDAEVIDPSSNQPTRFINEPGKDGDQSPGYADNCQPGQGLYNPPNRDVPSLPPRPPNYTPLLNANHPSYHTQSVRDPPTFGPPTEDDLNKQIRDLTREFEDEKRNHAQTQEDRDRALQDAQNSRKLRFKALNDLDQVMRQNQGFDQLTDSQVIQKITHIRNLIRNFAVTYTNERHEIGSSFKIQQYLDGAHVPSSAHHIREYLDDVNMRPGITRAIIWDLLLSDLSLVYLLGSDEKLSRGLNDASWYLRSGLMNDSGDDPDAMRKYHIWRANGNAMMLDMATRGKHYKLQRQDHLEAKADDALRTLDPLLTQKDAKRRPMKDDMCELFDKMHTLNDEISKQVADFTWKLPLQRLPCPFEDNMAPETGGKPPTEHDQVALVLSPGLEKRGTSSGDDFHKTQTLMKIEVVGAPVRRGVGDVFRHVSSTGRQVANTIIRVGVRKTR